MLLLVLFMGVGAARADTPIALTKSFDGRVNFTGTQVTLRTKPNGSGTDACLVAATSTNKTAVLNLPSGATVLSAQLYWAGSGTADYTVTFQGAEITASRKYTSTTVGNGFNYFGGAADVTSLVKGGGTYNFSGLTVSTGTPWCASQGVLGGFSLLVVYSLASEPERVLNLYEGFTYLQNSSLVVDATNFRWAKTLYTVQEKARVGHITWEGDPTLAQDGERLSFEGAEMTDTYNPAGNQFNSQSNINFDKLSYGIDFDAYDTTVTTGGNNEPIVSTTYKAGQDLVLLNAEILVVPTMPISDLSIAIARTGALKIGTDVEYKVTVTNKGTYTEAGPIVVTNTLPAGMYYVSGVVTGWSCTASTTAGTCTYNGSLAPGASLPVLTVRARVTTVGEKTNTVKVSGKTTDDNQVNNTASDTGTATTVDGGTTTPPATIPSYMFTDSKCVDSIAIGAAGQTCKRYTASTTGGKPTSIWLTATDSKGVPTTPSTSKDTTASMQFMLECISPATGTKNATYKGNAMAKDTIVPVCTPPGTAADWSGAASVAFPAKTVSVELSLVYPDVGQVRFNLKENKVIASTEVFVSAPLRLAFNRIAYGKLVNPGATAATGQGFAPAGASVQVEIGALLNDQTTYAPNFGNESTRPLIVLGSTAAAGTATAANGVLSEPDPEGRSWAGGIMSTKLAWSEVGAVNFTARADDPNPPTGATPQNRYFNVPVGAATAPVGRFYPSYFKTEVSASFDCPPTYPCPATENRAIYSGQPFTVTVYAYNEANIRLENYKGEWYRPVTLQAVGPNGGALLPAGFALPAGKTSLVVAAPPAAGQADAGLMVDRTVTYKLAVGYDNGDARALKPGAAVTAPAAVYVRAVASESIEGATVTISSQRATVRSDEEGVTVLNGRLKLPNALGSDLLATPLALRAEYWNGTAWMLNKSYSDKRAALANTQVTVKNCTLGFLTVDNQCDTAAAGAALPQAVTLSAGAGMLRLRAPGKLNGATRRGRFDVDYKDNAFPWLPATTGRISFGSYRSPLIYVREMYF
jgi:uncharacterized repeat protein (TIGR01451 family)